MGQIKKRNAGFTLVELMIVIVIVGSLAAVAVPAFSKFIRKSKSSEASINVKAIANGAVAWYAATHISKDGNPLSPHFPNQASPFAVPDKMDSSTVPGASPCAKGSPQYEKDSTRWEIQPWKSLKFGINRAHYFQYTYQTSDKGTDAKFMILAESDLTCMGKSQTFLQCSTVNNKSGEVERSNMVLVHVSASKAPSCLPSEPIASSGGTASKPRPSKPASYMAKPRPSKGAPSRGAPSKPAPLNAKANEKAAAQKKAAQKKEAQKKEAQKKEAQQKKAHQKKVQRGPRGSRNSTPPPSGKGNSTPPPPPSKSKRSPTPPPPKNSGGNKAKSSSSKEDKKMKK